MDSLTIGVGHAPCTTFISVHIYLEKAQKSGAWTTKSMNHINQPTGMAPQVVLAPNPNQSIWRTRLESGSCSNFCSVPTLVVCSTAFDCRIQTGNGGKLRCSQAELTKAIKAAVDMFSSISCWYPEIEGGIPLIVQDSSLWGGWGSEGCLYTD